MTEENKYYKPEISEFHKGFEFEGNEKNGWQKFIYQNERWYSGSELELLIKSNCIRVKYLTKEDIEACGWKFNNTNKIRDWYVGSDKWFNTTIPDSPSGRYWDFRLIHDPELHTIKIESGTSSNEWEIFFNGICKNKSELQRIMKMVGI